MTTQPDTTIPPPRTLAELLRKEASFCDALSIDPDGMFAEGDVVAWSFGEHGEPMLSTWLGSTGRDASGRFVRKGSKHEHFRLEGSLIYTRRDIDSGLVRILGRIVAE